MTGLLVSSELALLSSGFYPDVESAFSNLTRTLGVDAPSRRRALFDVAALAALRIQEELIAYHHETFDFIPPEARDALRGRRNRNLNVEFGPLWPYPVPLVVVSKEWNPPSISGNVVAVCPADARSLMLSLSYACRQVVFASWFEAIKVP